MLNKLLKEKTLIPAGNLAEVRYEDLVANPLNEIKKIYAMLGLSIDQALPGFQHYLDRQARYKTNVYSIDDDTVRRVNQNWDFAFQQWKYPKRSDQG